MFILRSISITLVCPLDKGRKIMKNILLSFTLLITHAFAEVSASATTPEDRVKAKSTHSVAKRKKRSIRPAYKYFLLNQDHHYYRNSVFNCNKYLKIIEQKDKKIEALKKEIDRLRGPEQSELRKKLKEEHDLKMKKFDERKSGIRTQNIMRISTEPVK